MQRANSWAMRLFAPLVIAISLWRVAAAQDSTVRPWTSYDLPHLQQTDLISATGAHYRIIVASPTGPAPAKGYPVIYVVDGNAYTALVSEIIRFNLNLGVQSRVEPAVVVGIGYPTQEAYDLTRRKLDFTTKASTNHSGIESITDPTGGDVAFRNFIDQGLKPVIEARFRIDRTRQTLLGHSLGGLFVLETMMSRPQSFQTYVALSPSIWWNSDSLLRDAQHFIERADLPRNLRVFLSVGDLEEYMPPAYIARTHQFMKDPSKTEAQSNAEADIGNREMKAKTMVENVRRMAAILTYAHITTKCIELPGQDHFSVVPAALGDAVPFALSDELSMH